MTSLPTIRKRRKRWNLFFLALPLMLMVLAFRYAPLFGWYLSLVDYKVGQPIFKSRFVGLYFFKMLFTSRDMSRIMRNSIILSALKTVSLVLPPVFAILLNELNNSRFRKFAQTTTTLPHFVSWVIVYSIAYALFTSDGIVNQLLGLFGKSQKLLTNKNAVYGFQTGIWIWKNLGWKSIIYVAAIAGIVGSSIAVNTTKVKCDYFDFLKHEKNDMMDYADEYMVNYSWAEYTNGYLMQQNKRRNGH